MKQPVELLLGISRPQDGFTNEEQTLVELLHDLTVEQVYTRLPTARMKAITAMHLELGYDQEILGRIFGVSQERISQEVLLIKRVLLNRPGRSRSGAPIRPRKSRKPETISVTQLLELVMALKDS